MAVEGSSAVLAIRTSVGVELWASDGHKHPYEHKPHLPKEETKNSRSISFSPDGRFFAYSNGVEVKVINANTWQLHCVLPRPKAFYLKFSPRGNFLCTWELNAVTKDKPEGGPNMFVYELAKGDEVFAIVQKNQTDWEPSWSSDETVYAMVVQGEALFYDLSNGVDGFKSTTRRIGGSRGGMLSLGPGNSPYLATYTPGSKGGPSTCKLFKYPALGQNQTVAFKSFFQSDRVEMLWNKRGSGLLLLTSTEVDKSGASYYGNQALHFMATQGDSCSVSLSKQGPVHCVKWSPRGTEFVVVYGYMPSKAALYNLKCDVVFDFGEGPRNCAYFNPFGNLLVLAGFGNLPGNVEIWDCQKKEMLTSIKCADTTVFDWHPNGEFFLTATTAPRLRISNGFRVYHYSGALQHETLMPQGRDLLGVEWQQFAEGTFNKPIVTKAKHEGIKSSQPEASNKVYTPPHLRLIKEGKDPVKLVPQLKPNSGNPAGKRRKAKQKGHNDPTTDLVTNETNAEETKPMQKPLIIVNSSPTKNEQDKRDVQGQILSEICADAGTKEPELAENAAVGATEAAPKKPPNPEKEKKIRNVAKKLSNIKKLKARVENGETLELNQINKIGLESKLLEELNCLKKMP